MASEVISSLQTGVPKGTDLTPATDTTDTSSSPQGTTKKYVRSSELNYYLQAQGLTTYTAVRVATVTALTATYSNGSSGVGATLTNAGAQAALSIDGVALSASDRVLVKNQASTLQNGIYTVSTVGTASTNWVMTRATDFDQAAEIIQYAVVLSNQGATQTGLLWQETAAGPFTVGVSPITFAQYTTQSISLPVSLAQGGTSASLTANNGGIFYSTATAGAILAGTATANQALLSGISSAPSWSTATYPPTTTINQILYSSSANTITGLPTATGGVLITNSSGVPSYLANPSATGRFLQSVNGDSSIWSTAGFPTSVGAAGTVLRSDGTNWAASTATFANTYSASNLLYSNGANTVTGLATANNGVLVTDGGGIPSIGSTLPSAVQSNITAVGTVASGTWHGGVIGSTYGGTGVNNGSSTITLGGSLTMSGAFPAIFNITGSTNVTFPTSGTLATTIDAGGLLAIQVFTASGTYTPTATASQAIVEVIGGGGGSGGTATTDGTHVAASAGGGGGGYAKYYYSANPLASQTVTIGAGGTAGAAGNNAGGDGGTTSFGALCIATGGTGGGGGVASTGGNAAQGGARRVLLKGVKKGVFRGLGGGVV